MSTNVYVLRLENNKYYVGKTADPANRIRSHFHGYGCAWTKLHRPVEIRENASSVDENIVTHEYINRYGYQNVRGGSYCDVDLQESSIGDTRREVLGVTDRCLKCGRFGHFSKKLSCVD